MRAFGFSRTCAVALLMALCCATPLAAFEAELPEQIVTADAIGEEEAFSPGAVTIVRPKEMEGEQ